MWGGRLSMFGARGLGSLCGAFSVLKRCPEDRGHGDHAEQFGEGLGEYGSAHELCFGVPAVRQALCTERYDGVDDEGVAGDGAEGYGDTFRSAHHSAKEPCSDSCEDGVGKVESGESGNELRLVQYRRGVGGAHEGKK